MVLRGNGVSKGVAIGEIFLYQPFIPQTTEAHYSGDPKQYLEQYEALCLQARAELQAIRERMMQTDAEKAAIFSAQMEILCDEVMDEEIRDGIQYDTWMPDWAVETVYSRYERRLQKAGDPLIRERAADLKDVKNRLLRIWCGVPQQSLAQLEKPVIIAAHDLLPSDTAVMERDHVLGIVTESGGTTSHSAIIARSYGIPAVLGIPNLLPRLTNGEKVILDAVDGVLITRPDGRQEKEMRTKQKEYEIQAARIQKYLHRDPLTADGERIEIGLNIGSAHPEDLEGSSVTDFVGLFRTEFLYMDNDHLPTEEEQIIQYQKALLEYAPRPVVLRTLDIGGDKTLPYFPLPQEQNPFLGKRALRLCFDSPELFRTQLRAALRASVAGQLWIMLPMVSSIEEIKRAKALLEQAKQELRQEKLPFDEGIKLGIMIEIPAVAVIADLVTSEVDFASIGTNDLCQYLMAVDRMNPEVTSYYQSYHPALFRMIGYVVERFKQAGKPICICGELGGDPLAAPVLVGLGMRKLSMSLSSVAAVKRALAGFTVKQMEEMARAVENMTDGQAREYLQICSESLEK
uniref:phosphoenolpyruvate--protein phosphotransferase n=1 Tax=Candidatus Fimivicinus sp. TaxID=3056640 RepID=UPI003FF036F5